jgi:protein-L-isoaspartate(D-aspartate) O-methyltransferase
MTKRITQLPEDSLKHQGMRKRLIDSLREMGISNEAVLSAIMSVPRHYFFENAFINQAYSNEAFKIGEGQTISQPYTVAYQTSLLQLKKGEKVLEIGTGSGYQTGILVKMEAKVFSIERHSELHESAKEKLNLMGINAKLFHGDGFKGLPAYAPFDKILITCGAPSIPEELVKQLKVGGTMVIPIGAGEVQLMTLIEKISETEIKKTGLKEFRFVPMLENKVWSR